MGTITSKLYSLNLRDFFKGLLIAVLASVLYVLQQGLDAWLFHDGFDIITWALDPRNQKALVMAALSGGGAYLWKHFFTAQQVVTQVEPGILKAVPPAKRDKEPAI